MRILKRKLIGLGHKILYILSTSAPYLNGQAFIKYSRPPHENYNIQISNSFFFNKIV